MAAAANRIETLRPSPLFELTALEARVLMSGGGVGHSFDVGDVGPELPPFVPTHHTRYMAHLRHMKHLRVLQRMGPQAETPQESNPLSSVPQLNSYPSATASLYLDFDGNPSMAWGGYTAAVTPAYDRDGDATTFSDSELLNIQEIWSRVAEAYAPFNINVTTVDPGNLTDGQTVKIVIGGTGSWYGSAGGVAYLGSFYNSAPNVGWAFTGQLGNGFPKYTADAAIHEAGHTFGLYHQSAYSGATKTAEYRGGTNGIAPYMGVSYYSARAKWSNGQTTSSTTFQDDMNVIANNSNGFGYRADDHGDTIGAATALDVSGDAVSGSGVLTRTSDVDVFSVVTLAGSVTFNVNVGQYGPTLDATLKLVDANGTVLATSDTTSLGETITATVPDGSYRLIVSSKGVYGDVGAYTITGQIVPSADYVPAPTSLTAVSGSGGVTLSWLDNSTNETAFHVERSDDGGATWNNLDDLAADTTQYLDATASVGQSYRYRVYASGPVEDSGYSGTLTFAVTPAVPANFSASSISSSRIDLSWDDVEGETGYVIERSLNNSIWSSLATVGADVTSYSNTALAAATRYFYRIRANSAAGASANATAVNAFTRTAQPTLSAVVASAGQVNLTWTNVLGETGYRIESSTDGSSWSTVATKTVNAVSHSVTGLDGNTQYYFRVFAIDAGGDSAAGTATGTTFLGAPAGLAAEAASATQVDLTWSDSNGETGYRLERSLNQSVWTLVANLGAGVTSYSNSGLVAGTNYYFRLRALNAGGASSPGASANTVTLPAVPTLSKAVISNTQVRLSWTNVAGESNYVLQRSDDGSTGWTTISSPSVNVLTYLNESLTADTDYYYRVYAHNASGDSAHSSVVQAHTLLPSVTGLAATGSSTTQIDLTWDESTGETGYRIERSTNGTTFTLLTTVAADTHSYSNSGLVAGTMYYYRVSAVNAGGPSLTPTRVSAVTLPAAPVLSKTVMSDTQIRLSWTNVAGEANYVLQRSDDGSTGWTTIASPTLNVITYTNTGLTTDTDYYYRICAHNASGDSAYSSVVQGHTLLPAVTNLAATSPSATQIDLTWDDSEGESGYRVERSTNGTTYTLLTTLPADANAYSNLGLVGGTTYYYRVSAVNAGGASLTPTRAAGLTRPAAATLTSTALSTTQVRLNWTNVAGESGYRIERSDDGSTGWATIATTGANVITYTNSGLTANTTYYYRITPFNASGDGATTTTNRTTLLGAPIGLSASPLTTTSVTLTWTDSTGETAYKVERLNGTAWVVVGSPAANATTFTNTGLVANRTYFYRLRAVNAGGDSTYSTTAQVTTPATAPRPKAIKPSVFQSARLIDEV